MVFKKLPLTEREVLKVSPKILIVDDSQNDRRTYRRYLELAKDIDCQILEAVTLAEGIKLWHSHLPTLLLLDIHLPDGSGLDLLEIIRDNNPYEKLPVIALAEPENARLVVQAMKLGVRDVLFKADITADLLNCCVITALQEITLQGQTPVKELSESENRLRQLAENIHQVFYLVEVQTSEVLYISPGYETIWGRSCQSLYDNPFSYQETIYSEDIEIARQSYQGPRLGKITQAEYRIVRPDGSLRWIRDRNFPVRNQVGEIYRSCGIAEDITEQKEAQIQLVKTEKLFREAQRIAHLGNWELDLRDNYLYWSEEIFRIFEIDPQQFTPSYEGFLAKIHPEDQELVNNAYSQHLRNQLPYCVIHRLLMADGRIKYVQEQCETVFAEDGTPLVSQGTVQDITEIKEAELQLQKLNQSLELTIAERTRELSEINTLQQTILDGTDLSIISTNFEGIIQTFNRGAEKMLGYSAEEMIGKCTPDLFMLPEDMQQIARNLSAEWGLEVEGNVKDISLKIQIVIKEQELTQIHKDGSRFPVQLSVNPLKNDQHQIIGFLGISKDITLQKESDRQRQEAEAALRKSELRFRRMFESDVVGMMFCNFRGEILDANDRFLAIIGYSRDDLARGHINWAAMTPPQYRQLDLNAIEHLKLYRSMEPWEKVYIHKDGHSIPVLVGVALLSEDDDSCVCVVIDISDRKEAEKNLEKSRAKFQRLVDEMGDKFVVFSHSGIEGILNYVSDGTYPIFAIRKEEVLGKCWAETANWLPEDIPVVTQKIMAMAQGKIDFYQNEMRFIHPDGGIRTTQVSHHPIKNEAGELIAIEGIVEDITERKLAEIELKNTNEELEKLLKLREETLTLREDMSNMIVHDLRNPLSAILLSAEIIQRYGDRPDQKALVIKKAEQILKSGNRMKNMIDSLLLMAKLESGKILFNPVPTDLHKLGASILTDFELTANAQAIELKGELPNPGNSIFIDGIILRRVIENLISNAIKFSPPNSQVWLQIEYLPENHLRVKVIDNGPGVSPERAEDIFKKFEIGTVKQNVSQIGLGLAFCKMAVEAQGGTLAIAPNQPQGSIFTVEI